ncbi:MAG: hypothetical protein IKR53_05170, partial [Clostridia bacterium]|nr:hypothetical protein [Clostridia bacterium]
MTVFRFCAFGLMILMIFTLSACRGNTVPSSAQSAGGESLLDDAAEAPPQTAEATFVPDLDCPATHGDLRAKFPEYFEQPTAKGLELYAWKTDAGEWECGVMMGTNRNKTAEEIGALKPASLQEMREILASYDIPSEDVFISYVPRTVEEWPGESELAALRCTLLPEETPAPLVCMSTVLPETGVAWLAGCKNGHTMTISSVCHLPLWTFDSRKEFDTFLSERVGPDSSANVTASRYVDEFFENHVLVAIAAGKFAPTYSFRIGSVVNENGHYCVHVKQILAPDPAESEVNCFIF